MDFNNLYKLQDSDIEELKQKVLDELKEKSNQLEVEAEEIEKERAALQEQLLGKESEFSEKMKRIQLANE